MSSRARPILAHRWPPPPTGYLPTRFASDARNGLMRLMRAPSRVCVMLRSEGVSLPDYFSERPKHAKFPEFHLYVVVAFQLI